MKYKTPSLNQSDEHLFLNSSFNLNIKPIHSIQDHVHMAAKFRNRSLCPGIVLPMGNKIANVSHLKILINDISKDTHGLVIGDVCPDDHQNYKSINKVMNPRVLNALNDHVVDSGATIMYFKICSEITSAFMDNNLEPVERVFRIFHGTYFLRSWKSWLQRPGIHFN